MIDIVQDAVQAFELPTGMCLTVRNSTPGSLATIALLSGAVTLPAVSTASGSASVGPFSVPCRVSVSAIGGVSVEMLNAANHALVSADGIQTWANRGLALAAGLTRCFITDVGIGGSYWDYLGGRWRPQARFVTLKNLTSSVTQTSGTRAVMDFCTLPAGLWQDGDILECDWYKAMVSGTDTDTTETAIGTVAGTFGTSLGLSTAALTNVNPVVSATYRWRRVSASTIRHAGIGGSSGRGAAGALLSDITSGFDLDANDNYVQLSGDLTTGAGAVSALRACTWTLYTGA